ncbi:MAG: hypothetical protein AB7P69_11970 [Candidatus Binatia bacterium]
MKLRENIGVLRAMYFAENKEKARALAEQGICGVAFREFFYADEAKRATSARA